MPSLGAVVVVDGAHRDAGFGTAPRAVLIRRQRVILGADREHGHRDPLKRIARDPGVVHVSAADRPDSRHREAPSGCRLCQDSRARSKKLTTRAASGEPSVGLEPTTPSLPWKGKGFTGVHGRSRTGTKSLQKAAIRSVRLWRPKCGRCGSSGRGVDALPSPICLRIFRADTGRRRAAAVGPPGRPDAV